MRIFGNYQRLMSMSADEIRTRARQELAKRLDTLGLFQPSFPTWGGDHSTKSGCFFFDQEMIPERLHLLREQIPDFENNVIDQAEQILNHRFSLLGYGPVDYGKEIDWQLDNVNGKRAPFKPWPQIRYLDFNAVGDSKVTWELSRHQFLVTLAKAWLLSGEERFLKKLQALYYDWRQKNPYPFGINWASSLEVAFRSLAWIWVRELLGGCEQVLSLRRDLTQGLAFNAWYIRRYLSTYFSPNTHLQGEAVALFFIGSLYPSLPKALEWRNTGYDLLLQHALTKVLEDGAYFEQSTYYHVYALDFFLHARILAERNKTPFPDRYDQVLQKMLEHLALLCQAGPPSRLGDDDGGRVFDGRRNRAEHLPDPLAIGTALYAVNAFKQPGVQATEEMIWLLGEAGLQTFSGYPEWTKSHSAQFPHTGLYLSHAGNGFNNQALLDAGPLGGGSGGHGHADALSLTLNLDGKPLLVDPGACNYVGPSVDRTHFRSTQAHNTVMVDGLSQAQPRTEFSWFRWPKITIEAVAFTPEFDFMIAAHDGYSRLQTPVTHRRLLFMPREGFWFILDELISTGPHDYALHWHLAPGVSLERQTENRWKIELEASRAYILSAAEGWSAVRETGSFSPAYGVKELAPLIRFSRQSPGKEIVATLFYSAAKDQAFSPTLMALDSANVPAYRLENGVEQRIFLFRAGIADIQFSGWETDARFVYAALNEEGLFSRIIFVEGSLVRYQGITLQNSSGQFSCLIWKPDTQQLLLSA